MLGEPAPSSYSKDSKTTDMILHTEENGFFLPLVGFVWCGGYQNRELARNPDLLHCQPNKNLEAFIAIPHQLGVVSWNKDLKLGTTGRDSSCSMG